MRAEAERRTWPRVVAEATRVYVELPGTAALEGVLLDCSPGGCRVEAPAAPGIGQRVACTVRSFERELFVSGVVAWRREDRLGAEFGLEVEAGEREALLAVMAAWEPSPPACAAIGERVKLHLPGVATPMRARIKRVSHGEVVVGSTLQFLTVGVRANLERLQEGTVEGAEVASVTIDVDELTGTPSLLVKLRVEEPTT